MLNWFPPLLFQRIRVEEISEDFRYCRIRVRKSWLTRNLHGATFGGTIFSGADPAFAVMFWQVFARRGESVQAWLKSARIEYLRPAWSSLVYEYRISEEEVEGMARELEERGTGLVEHVLEAVDEGGVVCARVVTVTYLRRLREGQREASGY
jgi:acyl-coenzyme A thioesterase PaaI-like protein